MIHRGGARSAWGNSEIDQAIRFVSTWRRWPELAEYEPISFDYADELVGGRTPCLEGAASLRVAAAGRGWRYDSCGVSRQVWPRRLAGRLWDLSMTTVPFAGHRFEVVPMDYNFMANQATSIDPRRRRAWRVQARDSLLAGFTRAVNGNRAPLIIGNHFEDWNGGIYLDAVEEAARTMAKQPDVQLISMRDLCDWLDAQDPVVLAKLQRLEVGARPRGGWASYLAA